MKEIKTSPHTDTIIDTQPCITCGAHKGAMCREWHSYGPHLGGYNYVVPPHPTRVYEAGFRIVPHPAGVNVRWYKRIKAETKEH